MDREPRRTRAVAAGTRSGLEGRLSAGTSERMGPPGRLVSLHDGREYRVAVVPFGLGRDGRSEVVIASPDASDRHAEIVARPDGDVLVDLSANGTFVNGGRIDGRRPLKALDVIRIGAEEFRYYSGVRELDGPAVPPVGAAARLSDTLVGVRKFGPLAVLRIKSGESKGVRHQVGSAVVTVGRAETDDVRLLDASIGGARARIQLREGVWTLTAIGSEQGLLVDDQPVVDETPLSPGATIQLGEVAISFEPNDDRIAAAPRLVPPAPAVATSAPSARPLGRRGNPAILAAAIVLLAAALVALVLFV